jgi:acetoin utilization deacetylase AcuC-like enzyme
MANISKAKREAHGHGSRRDFLKTTVNMAVGLGTYPLLGSAHFIASTDGGGGKQDNPAPAGTGFVFDKRYLNHTLGRGHPESPERLRKIVSRLRRSGLSRKVDTIHPSGDPLSHIELIHPESHIELVAQEARDESICRLAVAGVLKAVDAVCEGTAKNAFCAIRPPGHHATDTGEYGFCFYNNVAIAARYAQQRYKLKKILIADWDYHHGNGTEWAFYDDPSVLFFSTHALYAFPGTGDPARTGRGAGKGFNINVPLPSGATDEDILQAFEKKLVPFADKFRPDLVLISAGFDSREDDLLGDFAVTDEGFATLTRLMVSIAERHSRSRLVSVLEGGYDPDGLALAVESHIRELLAG